MDSENTLKRKWLNFFKAIVTPVPVFSIIGAVILIAISVLYKDKLEFAILINLIGSLFIGIAGAFIKGGYDELNGESILVKKGQSAIRNLSSISHQIIQIRNWISSFIKKDATSKRELEEINRHLETTTMNINSGLADWTDIVPELKQTEEVVKNYESLIKTYIDELLKNKKELVAVGENKELKKQLEGQINELELKVKNLRQERSGVFGSGLMVSPSSSFASVSPMNIGNISNLFPKVCSNCGKPYEENTLLTASAIGLDNLCSDCKKKSFS